VAHLSGTELDVVTGAFGYTGRHITRMLLAKGRRVRTLTGHPDRDNPFGGSVQVSRYAFDDPDELVRSLSGARTLYNTYWIRFEHRGRTFAEAIRNSRALFAAAAEAGVRRIVHVSITKPDEGAKEGLPYFVGKREVERTLLESGSTISWAIVRPTVVFGPGDILINNIAWLLRRLPVFAIPGDGAYRVRPVAVQDVARLCVDAGQADDKRIIEAVGPDTFTFDERVRLIRAAVRSRARLVHASPDAALVMARALGPVVGDRLITRDEIRGMIAELVTTDGKPTGEIRFADWLAEAAPTLGKRFASEIGRHYR